MLLVPILLASIAVAKKHREIALAEDHDMVLVMTDKMLGFQSRESIPKGSERAHVLLENNSIKIGDRFICKSPKDIRADMCVTSKALGGSFVPLSTKNHRVLMQDGHLALGKGAWDGNTDTFNAVITDAKNMEEKDYYLDVLEYQDEELVATNPKINLGAK